MADFGRIDALIYNVGAGVFKKFSETTEEEFDMCWKSGPKGLFSFAKAVLPIMEGQESKGVLGVTGATASWRGMPSTAAFAPSNKIFANPFANISTLTHLWCNIL